MVRRRCWTAFQFERLRAAHKRQRLADENPSVKIEPEVIEFIRLEGPSIQLLLKKHWPDAKLSDITHWSNRRLPKRVHLLSPAYAETYALLYDRFSWMAHGGLSAVAYLQPITFVHLCSIALHHAAKMYNETLQLIVEKFKLEDSNPSIFQELITAEESPIRNIIETERRKKPQGSPR
jgi:hypothetical protein